MIWTVKSRNNGVIIFQCRDVQGLECNVETSKTLTKWSITDINTQNKIAYSDASHPLEAIKAVNKTITSQGELYGSKVEK